MECTCISGVGNLGTPSCQTAFDVVKRIILVNYFKSDGSINGFDYSALSELNQAFLDSKLYANDPIDRWYITPEIKNIENVRGEDLTESYEDGTTSFIQEGARTFTGVTIKSAAAFKGQLDSWKCKTVGFYEVDKSGNLIGDTSVDGVLNPIKIQDGSLASSFVYGTDTTIQKVSIVFTVDQLMNDANLNMISASNITGNLSGANGLLDAIAKPATSISTTGFTVNINTVYGSVLSASPAMGLELADFAVYNVTQSSSITPTSVTESSDGVYVFVYTAVTSADVIRVSNKTSGELDKGFDIETFTVTTP